MSGNYISLRSRKVPRVLKVVKTLDVHPETEIQKRIVTKEDVYHIFSCFSSTREQPYHQYLDEYDQIRHIEVNAQILHSQANVENQIQKIGKLQMVRDVYEYIYDISSKYRLGNLSRRYKAISTLKLNFIDKQIKEIHEQYSISQILNQTFRKTKMRDPSTIILQYV